MRGAPAALKKICGIADSQELHDIVESDRYPFSPRIRTLRAILTKLRPEPVREPLPPPKGVCVTASYRSHKTTARVRAQHARPADSALLLCARRRSPIIFHLQGHASARAFPTAARAG
jgi:hypothetical protein